MNDKRMLDELINLKLKLQVLIIKKEDLAYEHEEVKSLDELIDSLKRDIFSLESTYQKSLIKSREYWR